MCVRVFCFLIMSTKTRRNRPERLNFTSVLGAEATMNNATNAFQTTGALETITTYVTLCKELEQHVSLLPTEEEMLQIITTTTTVQQPHDGTPMTPLT